MKAPRVRKLARILFVGILALFALLILLLHVASFFFGMHDRVISPFATRNISYASGRWVRCYELKQPEAKWDIIFVHGTPASAAAFMEQFRHPFPSANLVAYDRPGFGGSGPGLRKPSLDDQASVLDAMLPGNPARKTILVGHSYGAPIALLAALKFPKRVAGVVLIGGSVDPAQERTYILQRVADWPILAWLDPRPLRQCNRELLSLRADLVSLQRGLPALSVPVVMLHGGRDPLVPVANVDYLRDQLAALGKTNLFSELVYPTYNHFIPWEHPDAVEKAIALIVTRQGETAR